MSPPKVDIPKTNLTQQLKQTLKGYQATAQGFLDLNTQMAGPYTDLNLNTLNRTLFGSPNAPGELATQSKALTTTRTGDITDIESLGRRGYDALMLSNPGLARSLAGANAAGDSAMTPSPLMLQLQDRASSELALGGSLSPEESNTAIQTARSGLADRGIVTTTPGLAAEILARDQASQARLAQRMSLAQGVEGLSTTERAQGQDYLARLATLNAGVYDPSQQVISRSGTSLGGLLGNGAVPPLSLMGTTNTSQLYNPMGGADAFNTNLNAQASAAIANANGQAGTNSALIGGGAAIAGAAIIAI